MIAEPEVKFKGDEFEDYVKQGSDEIQTRAQILSGLGFGPMDSVHLAAAETSYVDYFVTCDDDLIKTARRNSLQLKINVVTLYELIELLYYA